MLYELLVLTLRGFVGQFVEAGPHAARSSAHREGDVEHGQEDVEHRQEEVYGAAAAGKACTTGWACTAAGSLMDLK